MAQKISQGNIFGRIGSGIGKGLAEQVPKEIANYRVASALENLEKTGQDFSPIQQYAALKRSGASDVDIANTLPLLERSLANKQASAEAQKFSQGRKTPVQGKAQENKANLPTSQRIQQGEGQPLNFQENVPTVKKRIITSAPTQAALNPIMPLSREEALQEGAQLFRESPHRYKTVEEGANEAINRRNAEIAQQNALINQGASESAVRQGLITDISNKTNRLLQGPEAQTLGATTGLYFNKVIDQADEAVANGENPDKASDDAAEKLRQFANVRLKTRTDLPFYKSHKGQDEIIKSQQKVYEDAGELKTMVNDLITGKNLSRPVASAAAYPIDRNKSIYSYVSNLKDLPEPIVSANYDAEKTKTKSIQSAKEIAEKIKPNDSLLAIGAYLMAKNYDPQTYLNTIRELYNDKKIALSSDQRDELDEVTDFERTLGDWYYFSVNKFKSLPEVK